MKNLIKIIENISNKIELQEWFNDHKVDDEMLWKQEYIQQFVFVRDKIAGLVQGKRDGVYVISTHNSKSITLPVYYLQRNNLHIILRNNFYNWKMSVISNTVINVDFDELFFTISPIEPDYTGNPLSPIYFEGFPEGLCFGYYEESDQKQFSAEIYGNYELWTSLYLIMKSLGYVKPLIWHTKKSHKKELEKQYSGKNK